MFRQSADPCPFAANLVPETFTSGLSHVELIGGGCARFVLYSNQSNGEAVDRLVVARIVMPLEAVPDAIRKALAAASHEIVAGALQRMIPLAVH